MKKIVLNLVVLSFFNLIISSDDEKDLKKITELYRKCLKDSYRGTPGTMDEGTRGAHKFCKMYMEKYLEEKKFKNELKELKDLSSPLHFHFKK